MALPWRTTDATGPDDPTVVGLQEDAAGDLLNALGSETARDLHAELQDSPATASDLADATGTTLQNVHYHIDRLEDAGVVEPVDTVYSETGNEMDVYAPSGSPLVLVSGDADDASAVGELLARLLGALAVLALASVAVQRLLAGPVRPLPGGGGQYAVPPAAYPPALGLGAFLVGLSVVLVWFAVRYRRLA